METSPLAQTRSTLDLSRTALAQALGVSYATLYQAEHGLQPLPRRAWLALAEIGVDVGDLERRQSAWFEDLASRLRAEIKARVGVSA